MGSMWPTIHIFGYKWAYPVFTGTCSLPLSWFSAIHNHETTHFCFALLSMEVLFTILLLWVTVTVGERMALATELQTLVKGMCLCLPFTNSVITHSHFPSVLLSWKSDFNFSGSTICLCSLSVTPQRIYLLKKSLKITIRICRIL